MSVKYVLGGHNVKSERHKYEDMKRFAEKYFELNFSVSKGRFYKELSELKQQNLSSQLTLCSKSHVFFQCKYTIAYRLYTIGTY